MIHYTRQGDTVYPSSRYMEIAMCPNDEDAQTVCDALNATAGIHDPAAALKAAREALERVIKAASWEVIVAGPNKRSEGEAVIGQAIAALAALKGEQP